MDNRYALVKKDVRNLEHVVQDEDLCVYAVKISPLALKYIENQTRRVCLAALERPRALAFIRDKTPEYCEIAVRADPNMIGYVPKPTYEMFDNIIKAKCSALIYLHRSPLSYKEKLELQYKAVKAQAYNIRHIIKPYREVILYAVKKTPHALAYVKPEDQDEEICKIAVSNDPYAIRFVNNITPDIISMVRNSGIDVEHLISSFDPKIGVKRKRSSSLERRIDALRERRQKLHDLVNVIQRDIAYDLHRARDAGKLDQTYEMSYKISQEWMDDVYPELTSLFPDMILTQVNDHIIVTKR